MTRDEERRLFEAYSRGEITRRELERQAGGDIAFGDALLKLYDYGLPLPRPKPDPHSPGARLLRQVLRGQPHG